MNDSNKMTVWFIIGFLVLVIAGVTIAYLASGGNTGGSGGSNASSTFSATTVPAISSSDWTQGNPNAKVTLTEYGDYECPACGAYAPIVSQVVGQYGSQIYYAFREFPLYSIHPNAGISAQAAEAAGLQGKYWQMHDILYKNQAAWSGDSPASVVHDYFDGYAQQIGLNVPKFDQDINSSPVINKIQNDVATGNAAQIDHTPTFFVNNVQIPNPTSAADFQTVLQQALKQAGVEASTSTASGTGQ